MRVRSLLALPLLAVLGCTMDAHRNAPSERYLLYLHGAIVEGRARGG